MYDKKTVEFYNNSVAKYIAWSKNNTSFKLEKKFLSLLVKPYSIFDIGCGAGHSAVWFSRKASKVIALDPSTKMTEKLKGLPKLETITQSILKIRYHNIFDGAWASFSLQHLKTFQNLIVSQTAIDDHVVVYNSILMQLDVSYCNYAMHSSH